MSPRLRPALGWLAFATPFVVYLALVLRYAVDVPIMDDFDLALEDVIAYQDEPSLLYLFKPLNEHRVVLNRVVIHAQLRLTGRVNFREQQIFGALGWCGAALAFSLAMRRELGLTLRQTLPFPLIMLAPASPFTMTFATPSMQFNWCVLFVVAGLICLSRGRVVLLGLCSLLAAFTAAPGVVL